MHKGTPIEKRDAKWHRRHERVLMKAKVRHNRGVQSFASPAPLNIEAQYKAAQERELQIKGVNSLLTKFINLKWILWLRNRLAAYQGRQYRGTR